MFNTGDRVRIFSYGTCYDPGEIVGQTGIIIGEQGSMIQVIRDNNPSRTVTLCRDDELELVATVEQFNNAKTYLFEANMRVAKEFDHETVDFLVENGYAEFHRTMKFHDGPVNYYRPL